MTRPLCLGDARCQGSLLRSATCFILGFTPGLSLLLQPYLRRHSLLQQEREQGMSLWVAELASSCTSPAHVARALVARFAAQAASSSSASSDRAPAALNRERVALNTHLLRARCLSLKRLRLRLRLRELLLHGQLLLLQLYVHADRGRRPLLHQAGAHMRQRLHAAGHAAARHASTWCAPPDLHKAGPGTLRRMVSSTMLSPKQRH